MNEQTSCRLFIRPKRANGTLDLSWEKFVVAVPLRLKCELMRIAREANVAQATLGLWIVQAAINDHSWLSAVLRSAGRLPVSGDWSDAMEGEQETEKRQVWSTGKKLVRFHIDRELYWFAQRAAADQKITMTEFVTRAMTQRVDEVAREMVATMTPEQAAELAARLGKSVDELMPKGRAA